MTEKKIRCDSCGNTPALELRYDFTREPDGAGSMETNSRTIDLCQLHATAMLQEFLQKPPASTAQINKEEFSRWARQQHWEPMA